MAITTRQDKGAPLTETEMDTNFTDLRDGVDARTPAGRTETGIKVGEFGADDYGWRDLNGQPVFDATDPLGPSVNPYLGSIRQMQFAENDQLTYLFHIPHDYLMGSDIFMHVHWSHNSATLTGGSATWGFELSWSKGFDQAAFSPPVTFNVQGSANVIPYQHIVTEGAASVSGGTATQIDTDDLEVDGVLICRFFLNSNDLTDAVSVPEPFVHFVDIHYQSTGVPTKNKTPDFWT
jgi:hypothetical protein